MTKLTTLGIGAIVMFCVGTGLAASQADIQACMTANQDIIANSNDKTSVQLAKYTISVGCSGTTLTAAMWQCIDNQVLQNGVDATTAEENCSNQIQ